jgi:hypothetical protein
MAFVEDIPETGSDKWFELYDSEKLRGMQCEQFVMWLLDLGLITEGDATRGYKDIRAIAAENIRKLRAPPGQ